VEYYGKMARVLSGPPFTVTEFSLPTAGAGLQFAASGLDGNVWFAEADANQIGQLVLDTYPLTASGTTLAATTGVRLTAVVASFTDTDPNPGPDTNYTARIAWGDGRISTGGISDNGGGNFDVASSHTYATAGTYTITVTVTDNDTDHDIGGSTVTVTSTANVSDGGGAGGSGAGGNEGIPFGPEAPWSAPIVGEQVEGMVALLSEARDLVALQPEFAREAMRQQTVDMIFSSGQLEDKVALPWSKPEAFDSVDDWLRDFIRQDSWQLV
jgi:hypothetical protein